MQVEITQTWRHHAKGKVEEVTPGVADMLVHRLRIAQYVRPTKPEKPKKAKQCETLISAKSS